MLFVFSIIVNVFSPFTQEGLQWRTEGYLWSYRVFKKDIVFKIEKFSGILSDEREGKIIQILISNILAIFFYGKPCISLTLPLEFPSLADIDYYFPSNIPKVETCAHSTS